MNIKIFILIIASSCLINKLLTDFANVRLQIILVIVSRQLNCITRIYTTIQIQIHDLSAYLSVFIFLIYERSTTVAYYKNCIDPFSRVAPVSLEKKSLVLTIKLVHPFLISGHVNHLSRDFYKFIFPGELV